MLTEPGSEVLQQPGGTADVVSASGRATGGGIGTSERQALNVGLAEDERLAPGTAPTTSSPPVPGSPRGAGEAQGEELSVGWISEVADGLRQRLQGFDAQCLSGDDAARVVVACDELSRVCGAARLACARRAAQCRVWHESGPHESPGSWLADTSGISVAEANRQLATAERLCELPELEHALRLGQLSPEQAGEAARAAQVDPSTQRDLIEVARHKPFKDLAARSRHIRNRATSAQGDAERARRQHLRRRVFFGTDDEGMGTITGFLPPHLAAELHDAVEHEKSRIFDAARRLGQREPHAAYRADALMALVCRQSPPATGAGGPGSTTASGTTPSSTTTGTGSGALRDAGASGEDLTPTRVSAPDAAAPPAAASGTTATGTPGSTTPGTTAPGTSTAPGTTAPGTTARRLSPRMLVRVDLSALKRGYAKDDEVCDIAGVGPVPVTTARQLLGESLLTVLVSDGVDITTVTSSKRYIPRVLDLALAWRDPTCVVPHCDATSRLERDHWRTDYASNGPTELDNLARICAHHHHQKTTGGYTLSGGPGGWRWDPPPAFEDDEPPPASFNKPPPGAFEGPQPARIEGPEAPGQEIPQLFDLDPPGP